MGRGTAALTIYQPVSHLVDRDGHVAWLHWTRVHVSIVLRNQVDVMEVETLEVVQLERLHEADVHDASFVECVGAKLEQEIVRPVWKNPGLNIHFKLSPSYI